MNRHNILFFPRKLSDKEEGLLPEQFIFDRAGSLDQYHKDRPDPGYVIGKWLTMFGGETVHMLNVFGVFTTGFRAWLFRNDGNPSEYKIQINIHEPVFDSLDQQIVRWERTGRYWVPSEATRII